MNTKGRPSSHQQASKPQSPRNSRPQAPGSRKPAQQESLGASRKGSGTSREGSASLNGGPQRQQRPNPRQQEQPAERGKPSRHQSTQPKSAYQQKPQKPQKPQSPTPANPKPNANEFTVAQSAGLLDFLIEKLSSRGRNSIKAVLARGQVSVNGRTITQYDYLLQPGAKVTVSWAKVFGKQDERLVGLSILHEDEDVIVIHKEAGLLSIATAQEKDVTAYRQLMDHVRHSDPRSRIFVVHRLDRDTSGVMLFAKSERVQQQLQNDWQEAVQERTYTALVEGTVKQEQGTIQSWLKENKAMIMYSSQTPDDGQLAITHYKVVKSNAIYSLLDVQLETGRKNQIRVHMKDIGHPIVGDKKYGSKGGSIGRLGLHARVLAFRHPTKGKLMRFESPVPQAMQRVFRETGGSPAK